MNTCPVHTYNLLRNYATFFLDFAKKTMRFFCTFAPRALSPIFISAHRAFFVIYLNFF